MEEGSASEVTDIQAQIERGSDTATAALLTVLYRELHALTGSYFLHKNPEVTLQPTALVHEAFIKLTGPKEKYWESRAHFFAVAARAMRQILANHVKSKKAAKRGGGRQRVTLSGLATPSMGESQIDLIDLDDALAKLAERAPGSADAAPSCSSSGSGDPST